MRPTAITGDKVTKQVGLNYFFRRGEKPLGADYRYGVIFTGILSGDIVKPGGRDGDDLFLQRE